MEKYNLIVLKFLSEQTELTDFSNVKIDGIADDFLITVKNDLAKKDLINCGSGHYAWINEDGRDYLKKREFGIKESNTAVHIGHNINAPVSRSDFSNKIDNSFNNDSQNANVPIPSGKKSIPDKVFWILGGLASVATIWGLLHALHITIKF